MERVESLSRNGSREVKIAGAKIVIVEANGILSCVAEVDSKLHVVASDTVAPIIIDLIRILCFQERSSRGAIGGESIDIE